MVPHDHKRKTWIVFNVLKEENNQSRKKNLSACSIGTICACNLLIKNWIWLRYLKNMVSIPWNATMGILTLGIHLPPHCGTQDSPILCEVVPYAVRRQPPHNMMILLQFWFNVLNGISGITLEEWVHVKSCKIKFEKSSKQMLRRELPVKLHLLLMRSKPPTWNWPQPRTRAALSLDNFWS